MITLTDVHKRYWTSHGAAHWVLKGISMTFTTERNVAVLGVNGAGKSTLLRLIGGVDTPTRGEIRRQCRVSWPLGLTGGLQPMLTGRQNAKFICRIHGAEDAELRDRIDYVHDFSDLGEAFDEPIRTYSSGMRARLSFALSLAFRFEMYLIDEVMSVGDAAFRVKSRKAFDELAKSAGLILVSHSDATMKTFCDAAIWLHEGQVVWFDSVDEAIATYNKHAVPQ